MPTKNIGIHMILKRKGAKFMLTVAELGSVFDLVCCYTKIMKDSWTRWRWGGVYRILQ